MDAMSIPQRLILWTLVLIPFAGATMAHLQGSAPTLSVSRPPLPALAFDQYLVDLGLVQPASEVRANFVFRHRGDHAARILEVRPSCGCLQPRFAKDEYLPGDVDVLVLRVQPASESPGRHEYFVDIKYADPEIRETRVTFRVQLPEKGISVTPPALIVYQLGEQPTTVPVKITDTRGESWSVRGSSVTLPFVTAKIGDPVRTESGTLEVPLEATVAAEVPHGRHRGLITVYTTDPNYPDLKIPLLIQGPEDFESADSSEEHRVP
jgi:hypothetical protein